MPLTYHQGGARPSFYIFQLLHLEGTGAADTFEKFLPADLGKQAGLTLNKDLTQMAIRLQIQTIEQNMNKTWMPLKRDKDLLWHSVTL